MSNLFVTNLYNYSSAGASQQIEIGHVCYFLFVLSVQIDLESSGINAHFDASLRFLFLFLFFS